MRILIADDHDLVREMMAAYLERDCGMKATQSASFDEAMAQITGNGPFELVLLDYRMPGMKGLEGLRAALEASGGNPVASPAAPTRTSPKRRWPPEPRGSFPRPMSARSMTNAVKFMVMGETYVPVDFMTAKEADNPAVSHLTPRERQVLEGISKGKSNKEIALDHDIQEVTVKLHVKTLCRKMGAKNRTQAAMMARDQEMV
ncbi:LOW QUALITY PROTEIN: DNA-binding response regulator, LuxR family [Limimaricola cinnabarinus LL-001]|uniref:DNA-binding response regulator, LuxR family n=1 Tax=Limimaricola cinnabarinus LL-001 TaxID=1337093 RepID=U2YYK3_9RHOB|nr:LOW QUALITY PROTEIN: DNA-binding response regulator, LuxR family [Limimaricola cinnabarinus LL-001]